MTQWATQADAERIWLASSAIEDFELDSLLADAQEQCEAYAPALAAGSVIPSRYVRAVVLQARELHNAAQRDGSDVIGVGDFVVRARPLTAAVKALLRPQQGRPRFGARATS